MRTVFDNGGISPLYRQSGGKQLFPEQGDDYHRIQCIGKINVSQDDCGECDTGADNPYLSGKSKAVNRLMDAAAADSQNPLLCFVDEVLRGTNTVERIAASAQILEKLSETGIYCFAATHDIELTHLLARCYDNCHFEEEVKDGDVLFSYRLLGGRAHTRNAIKLLEIIGFSKDIIQKADDMAGEFLRNGEWKG